MRPSQPARAIVLLMPSRGEEPKKLFWHTAIPRHLAMQGFITIVPRVDYALILEEETKNILDHVTALESARAALPTSGLLIGGFSSGGAIAAHYAEYKLSEGGEASVKGVFLIDPPLDLARFYNAWTKLINSACPEVIISEGKFIKKYVEKIAGGTPEEAPGNYLKHSAFTAADSLGGNAKFLRNVPIRLYTEPDLKAMQKYCTDVSYQNLNSSDLDALHGCLTKLGNPHVEYIKTTGCGLHSWNIADPDDLARWAERLIPDK
jgi:pimeloyl-ACP methyl ester carboxylesterase